MKKLLNRLFILFIKFKEKKFGKKLRYLFFENKSKTLMVVFPGFSPGEERRYNYIKSFKDLKCDKLFLLDVYGYKGSYFLYENGSSYPQKETLGLLHQIINGGV